MAGKLPAVYIDGQYIGGLEELQELADCGDLRVRLAEFDKLYERHKCPECAGTGKVLKSQTYETVFPRWNAQIRYFRMFENQKRSTGL